MSDPDNIPRCLHRANQDSHALRQYSANSGPEMRQKAHTEKSVWGLGWVQGNVSEISLNIVALQ